MYTTALPQQSSYRQTGPQIQNTGRALPNQYPQVGMVNPQPQPMRPVKRVSPQRANVLDTNKLQQIRTFSPQPQRPTVTLPSYQPAMPQNMNLQPRLSALLTPPQRQTIQPQTRASQLINNAPMYQTMPPFSNVPTNQSVILSNNSNVPQPTVSYQSVKVEQPLMVVNLKQYEDRWKQRIEQLEAQLSNRPAQYVEQEKVVYYQDNHRINDYEDENENLRKDLDQLHDENQQLQQELNKVRQELIKSQSAFKALENDHQILEMEKENLQTQVGTKDAELKAKTRTIQDLHKELAAKDKKLDEKQDHIDELNDEIEDQKQSNSAIEEKNAYLLSEINNWRQQFIDRNKQYNAASEQLTVVSAELDQLRMEKSNNEKANAPTRSSQRINTVRPQRQTNSPRNSEKSALNANDIEKIQALASAKS